MFPFWVIVISLALEAAFLLQYALGALAAAA